MKAVISKAGDIEGRVRAPPSKSYTHRAFVISGLAEGNSRIKEPLLSGDTLATLRAMEAFGAGVEKGRDEVLIRGASGRLKSPEVIDCENSGTSLRLLTGVAALDGEVMLTGDASLRKRPVQPLLDALAQMGVKSETLKANGRPPLKVYGRGKIEGGEVKIRGDMSSQFISSLLIISPYAEGDVEINITTPLKSKPYIDITLEMMRSFGADVENRGYKRFIVPSSQNYRGRDFKIEGDYSSASYFIALASMSGGRVEVENLNPGSLQGDRRILEIVEEMGAEVKEHRESITVEGGELKAIEVDLGDTPDLLPTVAVLAAKAEGKSVIYNVEHARYKESDRIRACAREIEKFGCRVEEKKDGLEIQGSDRLKGARVESYSDHRMVMALSILGLVSDGETVVEDVESVAISYPGFFDALKELVGGKVRLLED